MSRNPLFHQFSRTLRLAWFAERMNISTDEALERVPHRRVRKRSNGARGVSSLATWRASRRRARSPRSPDRSTPSGRSRAAPPAASRSSAPAWPASPAPIACEAPDPRDRLRGGPRARRRSRPVDLGRLPRPDDRARRGVHRLLARDNPAVRAALRSHQDRPVRHRRGGPLPDRRGDLPRIDDHRRVPRRRSAHEGGHALGDLRHQREKLRPCAGQRRPTARQHEPPGVPRAAGRGPTCSSRRFSRCSVANTDRRSTGRAA